MALNPSIILAGQPLDAVGALDRGTIAGQRFADARHQGEYRNALSQFGGGALQGEQGAMNELARFDPAAMQNLQTGQINQNIALSSEARQAESHPLAMETAQFNLDNARQQAAAETAQAAANLSAAERTAAQEQLSRAMTSMSTAQTPQQWNAYATEMGLTDYVGRFADKDFLIARATGTLEGLGGNDQTTAFNTLAQRAAAAGLQQGTPEYQQFMMEGGRQSDGMSMTVKPDGTVQWTQGAQTEPTGIDPTSPQAMIDSIDGILTDPDLAQGVGWRGAINDVLGPMAPNARRVDSRTNQLEGQAFLQAFESLKGAGQITEIEGQKATQAIGRLDTAQSEADYRAALTELRTILSDGQSRPQGWAATQNAGVQSTLPDLTQMSDAELQAIIDAGSN